MLQHNNLCVHAGHTLCLQARAVWSRERATFQLSHQKSTAVSCCPLVAHIWQTDKTRLEPDWKKKINFSTDNSLHDFMEVSNHLFCIIRYVICLGVVHYSLLLSRYYSGKKRRVHFTVSTVTCTYSQLYEETGKILMQTVSKCSKCVLQQMQQFQHLFFVLIFTIILPV